MYPTTQWPTIRLFVFFLSVVSLSLATSSASGQTKPKVKFQKTPGQLQITIGGKTFATYAYQAKKSTRPYFANVFSPAGIKVTRNYPPQKGDQTDHPHHQGIFVTFGDLNGIDYWHTKGVVVHENFLNPPKGGAGKGTFAVQNRFLSKDLKRTLCTEKSSYGVYVTDHGYLLTIDSTYTANAALDIGSKEEGGVAARVATPICVDNGGQMIDSEGRKGGKAIWGKKAAWVDYSGSLQGKHVGMTVMAHPKNHRPSWWHARDYGLFAANPFGPLNDKNGGMKLDKGESFRLRFGVQVHSSADADEYSPSAAFTDYVRISNPK